MHRPIRFDGQQARCVALAFGEHLRTVHVSCLACAVMPDHAHLVLERNERSIERLSIGLKAASSRALLDAGLHPFGDTDAAKRPKVWSRGERHPFLFDDADIQRAVTYVEENPEKLGFRRQHWSFVRKPMT